MLRSILLIVVIGILIGADARASYSEAHVAGIDAHVVVEGDGRISVTHALDYRVLAGTLRSIAITGFEDDWRFNPTAKVTSSDGRVFGAAVSRDDKGVVHLTVDDPKGLKRGDYRFEMLYESALGPRVVRDGVFDRVRFALPPMHEGIDGLRVVIDFPPAPTEPRAVTEADMAADLVTLRRSAEHDEIEFVRPHVPKGEAAAVLLRVDPKALSHIAVPRTEASAPLVPAAPATRPPLGVATLGALAALFVFGLALTKARILRVGVVGLIPFPASIRAGLAALAFGGGVLAEAQGRVMLGAALVAAALPLLAWRRKHLEPEPARGRATWLVIPTSEAFAEVREPADFLDATTGVGAAALGVAITTVALACWVARMSGTVSYWIAIDAFVLVPVFITGTTRQMPPSARREGVALAPIARSLVAHEELRVAPLASGAHLRLLVSPRLAMVGVCGIEVGVAWESAGGALLPSFDVLVRVQDDSFAAAKMTAAFPTKRALPGRKPDERVYRFEPAWPSSRALTALVMELADALRDRRLTIAKPTTDYGVERRAPSKRAATKGASLA
jgi:hypothetical protein